MILLDTNVVIDAQNGGSPFYGWSNQVIAEGISTDRVGINAITLAELCNAARADSGKVQDELHSADISITTRDVERYRIYFPGVELIAPAAIS